MSHNWINENLYNFPFLEGKTKTFSSGKNQCTLRCHLSSLQPLQCLSLNVLYTYISFLRNRALLFNCIAFRNFNVKLAKLRSKITDAF